MGMQVQTTTIPGYLPHAHARLLWGAVPSGDALIPSDPWQTAVGSGPFHIVDTLSSTLNANPYTGVSAYQVGPVLGMVSQHIGTLTSFAGGFNEAAVSGWHDTALTIQSAYMTVNGFLDGASQLRTSLDGLSGSNQWIAEHDIVRARSNSSISGALAAASQLRALTTTVPSAGLLAAYAMARSQLENVYIPSGLEMTKSAWALAQLTHDDAWLSGHNTAVVAWRSQFEDAMNAAITSLSATASQSPIARHGSAHQIALSQWNSAFRSEIDNAVSTMQGVASVVPATKWSEFANAAATTFDARYAANRLQASIDALALAEETASHPALIRSIASFAGPLTTGDALDGSAYIFGLSDIYKSHAARSFETRKALMIESYKLDAAFVQAAVNDMLQLLTNSVSWQQAIANVRLAQAQVGTQSLTASIQALSDFYAKQIETYGLSANLTVDVYKSGSASVQQASAVMSDLLKGMWGVDVSLAQQTLESYNRGTEFVIQSADIIRGWLSPLVAAESSAAEAVTSAAGAQLGFVDSSIGKIDGVQQLYHAGYSTLTEGELNNRKLLSEAVQGSVEAIMRGYVIASGIEETLGNYKLNLAKLDIEGQSTETMQNLQIDEREAEWDLTQFKHVGSFIGAISGAPILTPPPSPLQQALSALLGGAGFALAGMGAFMR